MIRDTELYDLSYVLILIRNDIECPLNIQVLKKTIEAVNDEANSFQVNNIRKYLSKIENLKNSEWKFAFVENYYTQSARIIKKSGINKFIVHMLENLLKVLVSGNYEQAYDLADLLHAMPEILAQFDGVITKSYWRHHINSYEKKWDSNFLKEYQKSMMDRKIRGMVHLLGKVKS